MEALILLHLEDLSFFYPIIASKAGVVALLSYSNCFTTPTLVDGHLWVLTDSHTAVFPSNCAL